MHVTSLQTLLEPFVNRERCVPLQQQSVPQTSKEGSKFNGNMKEEKRYFGRKHFEDKHLLNK